MKQSPFQQATLDVLNAWLTTHHGGVNPGLALIVNPATLDQLLIDTLLADEEVRKITHPFEHICRKAGHDLSAPGATPIDWKTLIANLLPLILAIIAMFGGGT
jgi:hypothetical protein